MAILVKSPAYVHTSFNPVVSIYQKEVSDGENMTKQIFNSSGNEEASLTAEFINDLATFHFESILSKMFFDSRVKRMIRGQAGAENYYLNNLYTDKNLVAPYGDGHSDRLLNLKFAINAASQFGFSQSLVSKALTFLTAFDRIKRYEGYEYALSFLGGNMGNNNPTYLIEDGDFQSKDDTPINLSQLEDDDIECPHFTLIVSASHFIEVVNEATDFYLRNNRGEIITNDDGVPILLEDISEGYIRNVLPVLLCQAPKHPFYVRWINRLGGWDAWMFGCRQYFSKTLSENKSYSVYFEDVETARGNSSNYFKQGKEGVSVSSGQINQNEYDVLSDLIYSPRIEWYNEKIGKWLSLSVDKGDSDIGSHNSTSEFIISFILPDPQLQF